MTSPIDLPTPDCAPNSEDKGTSAADTLASRKNTPTQPLSAPTTSDAASNALPSRGTTSVISRVPHSSYNLEYGKFLRDLFVSTFPAILALFVAPYLIRATFQQERAAAQPYLSIEYAFLTDDRKPLPEDVTRIISSMTTNAVYRDYRVKNWGMNDISTLVMPSVRLGSRMQEKLSGAVSLYEQYLEEIKKTLSGEIEALPTLSSDNLRMAGHEQLDSIAFLDDDKIREKLVAKYAEKMGSIASALDTLRTLKAQLANVPRVIRIKITILNKGATDGLVRHRGQIEYRGDTYEMKRTAPPTSDLSVVSVPVFQTNKEEEKLSPQSVGKVEKDSMTEFWYDFSPTSGDGNDISSLCKHNEHIYITLFDQNSDQVSKLLPCYEDEG